MQLDRRTVDEIARQLDRAERERRLVARATPKGRRLSLEDGYAIQEALRALKEARGTRVPGYKVGLTAPARLQRLGLSEPLCGFLTDHGAIAEGAAIETAELRHPRVEMELAFVLRENLKGPDCDVERVLDATAFVCAALEIIDSRYEPGPFDPAAAVADNVSTARYVAGTARSAPRALDLAAVRGVLLRNGTTVAEGDGSAVMGHPAESIVRLVRALHRRGAFLHAGSLLLSGGLADALPVAAGDAVTARLAGIGEVSCTFR